MGQPDGARAASPCALVDRARGRRSRNERSSSLLTVTTPSLAGVAPETPPVRAGEVTDSGPVGRTGYRIVSARSSPDRASISIALAAHRDARTPKLTDRHRGRLPCLRPVIRWPLSQTWPPVMGRLACAPTDFWARGRAAVYDEGRQRSSPVASRARRQPAVVINRERKTCGSRLTRARKGCAVTRGVATALPTAFACDGGPWGVWSDLATPRLRRLRPCVGGESASQERSDAEKAAYRGGTGRRRAARRRLWLG